VVADRRHPGQQRRDAEQHGDHCENGRSQAHVEPDLTPARREPVGLSRFVERTSRHERDAGEERSDEGADDHGRHDQQRRREKPADGVGLGRETVHPELLRHDESEVAQSPLGVERPGARSPALGDRQQPEDMVAVMSTAPDDPHGERTPLGRSRPPRHEQPPATGLVGVPRVPVQLRELGPRGGVAGVAVDPLTEP